jgi:hypothetical protein
LIVIARHKPPICTANRNVYFVFADVLLLDERAWT